MTVWFAITPVQAYAIDGIVELAYFEDRDGKMDWAEVQHQSPTPFDRLLTLGYGGAVWVKLRIDPSLIGAKPTDNLSLRIRPAYLDELTLYDPLQQPSKQGPIGDRYPLSAQAQPSTDFLFSIPAGAAPRDIWVRLVTTSTRMAYFEVLNAHDLALTGARIDLAKACYLGLIVILILWGLIHLFMRPEPLMLSFVIYQLSSLLFGAGMQGYSKLLLPGLFSPATLDVLTSFLAILAPAAATVFSHYLLSELGTARWRSSVVAGILTLFIAMLGLLVLGYVREGLEGNMLLILSVPMVMFAMAVNSRPDVMNQVGRGDLPKPWIVGYFFLTLLFTVMAAAPALGLLQAPEVSLYIVLFYSISSGLVMVALLQYRAHLYLKHQEGLAAEAVFHEQRAAGEKLRREDREKQLAQEERRRQEKEHFLSMLTHELRNPLSVIRMVSGAKETYDPTVMNAADDMAKIIDKVQQSEKLSDKPTSVIFSPVNIGRLLREVCMKQGSPERLHLVTNEEGFIQGDVYLLEAAVGNLIENALKYSPEGSTVSVKSFTESYGERDGIAILVTNVIGAAGLPDPAKVFSKYYRSTGAHRQPGSGLGLYLVTHWATAMRGHVDYQSFPEGAGHRVNFRLWVPR